MRAGATSAGGNKRNFWGVDQKAREDLEMAAQQCAPRKWRSPAGAGEREEMLCSCYFFRSLKDCRKASRSRMLAFPLGATHII